MTSVIHARPGAQPLQTHLRASGTAAEVRATSTFTARFRDARRGSVLLGRVAAGRHDSYNGNPRQPQARGLLVFTYLMRGHARFDQDGRTTRIDPGDFCVYAADRPYELHFETDYEIVGLVMPTEQLTAFGQHISAFTATGIASSDPIVAALGSTIDALEQGAQGAPPALQTRFIDHARDVMETLSRHAIALSGELPDERVALLNDALMVIDAHLHDPDLSPASVASELFVSIRTLYSLFEGSGLSVAATIRARRLARCCRDLADPALAVESVAAIGARWGFASPSYFSTVFYRNTGMTPREYRQRYATA